MNRGQFWKVVEAVRGNDRDAAHARRLRRRLASLPRSEIASFDSIFRQLRESAYRGDVWAAGVLLNHGHGSDDGFEYFRNWLISRGREVFEAALIRPDVLSRVPVPVGKRGPEAEFEAFGYAAADAYQEVTGREYRPKAAPSRRNELDWQRYTDAVFRKRLPALWRKFGRYQREADARMERRRAKEMKGSTRVSIKGLGVLGVGSLLRHKSYGVGKIAWLVKSIGGATAQVVFDGVAQPMHIDGASGLWTVAKPM